MSAPCAIRFSDFSSADGLELLRDAKISSNVLRLTPASESHSGAAWYREKQSIGGGFRTSFQFQLTETGGLGKGADGFAFVIQNSGARAIGGRGSAGGFAVASRENGSRPGIPWSFSVFFDTFKNREEGDPSDNYVAFRTSGRPQNMKWPQDRLAFTKKLHVHLKDRKIHTVQILFHPPMLAVYLDGSRKPDLEARVDLSIVVDHQGSAWVGFTASTGGGYENHDILNWSFDSEAVSSSASVVSSDITYLMWSCLPNRGLCTPEKAIVEPNAKGFHVVLPANVDWSASVPNPAGKTVEITNAHGIISWDLQAGEAGCSGPSGISTSAGKDFEDPTSPAGALIHRNREGRTEFSVNHRAKADPKENEGRYEFDVELK